MAFRVDLVADEPAGAQLQPIDTSQRPFSESQLQELLRRYPEIMAIPEIEHIYYPMIPIGREVRVSSGIIDNLYISSSGYLSLIETKLWRNPEARREVVIQAIEYAGQLKSWSYQNIDDTVREYTLRYNGKEHDLKEWLGAHGVKHIDRREPLDRSISRNLRYGRFLTLIVGDQIHESLTEALSGVERYLGQEIDVYLVELQGYRLADEPWPVVFFPRVVSKTETYERVVVRVVFEGKEPSVQVSPDRKPPPEEGGRSSSERKHLTSEDDFWALLERRAPDLVEPARQLIEYYKAGARHEKDIRILLRQSSLTVSVDVGTRTGGSLFFVTKNGTLTVWPRTFKRQLESAGIPGQAVEDYVSRLEALHFDRAPAGALYAPLNDVDLEQFRKAADSIVGSIRSHRKVSR